WGSGKSCVVSMLKRRLEETHIGRIGVYVFDAWSHEGDPLRRVFLEELTEFCKPSFDDNTKDFWDKRLKREISGSLREIEQDSKPVLRTNKQILALIGATLYPVALVGLGG